jgi:hypothetical protein
VLYKWTPQEAKVLYKWTPQEAKLLHGLKNLFQAFPLPLPNIVQTVMHLINIFGLSLILITKWSSALQSRLLGHQTDPGSPCQPRGHLIPGQSSARFYHNRPIEDNVGILSTRLFVFQLSKADMVHSLSLEEGKLAFEVWKSNALESRRNQIWFGYYFG